MLTLYTEREDSRNAIEWPIWPPFYQVSLISQFICILKIGDNFSSVFWDSIGSVSMAKKYLEDLKLCCLYILHLVNFFGREESMHFIAGETEDTRISTKVWKKTQLMNLFHKYSLTLPVFFVNGWMVIVCFFLSSNKHILNTYHVWGFFF